MPSMRAAVYRVAAAGPDDVSGVEALFKDRLDPKDVVAIMGKTEGNGCVNDFTRGFATKSFEALFARYGVSGVSIVMSGGTEGGLSPHWTIFARSEVEEDAAWALAIGTARTQDLPVAQLGRKGQVETVAAGVRKAMADAGIDDPADVHFVQIKCPLITLAQANEAAARGESPVTRDTLKSMAFSRGASSLGAAVALGEVDLDDFTDADICSRYELFSGRTSASSGVELHDHEIIVLGMSRRWSGPLSIDHAVMADAIDAGSVKATCDRLPAGSIVAVLAKAEADTSGNIRGKRHTMLDDSDIASTRHARAFVGGVLAGLFGMTDIYVSGGAEHQGPSGGGPVSIILHREISG
ncbi:ring-opening amidohydrolase [Oryzifoliimicrobium ureilyticus]|uniref:cyanuric acid amidohydrolase n=1 Tax=Oryzifoliimicrobium ureilyticus TaxID=3113724 RepID=UPI0030762346